VLASRLKPDARARQSSFRPVLGAGAEKKMPKRLLPLIALFVATLLLTAGVALAAVGHSDPWQIRLQDSATPVMDDITHFHTFVMYIISAITILVLALLVIVVVKFNARANPTPSKTTHHTLLEVAWTLLPVLILLAIAVPSFKLLFLQLNTPPADITVKATGKQWFWSYAYPDNGKFEFDSLMVQEKDLKPGQPRLLAVDNAMVVPVNKTIRVQTTGADVIHSFAVPAFGIKIDAVPGRLNETWFKATKEGIYYGQCSELCGARHGYMPIAVEAVPRAQFEAYIRSKGGTLGGEEAASAPPPEAGDAPAAPAPGEEA
jgi:cytochrome c oxidase subunit 2